MRGIKFIILFLACMLGMILQCEVFQTELWTFDQAYYMTSGYDVQMDQMEEFLTDLSNTAEQYDVHVFSTIMSEQSSYEMVLDVYGDGETVWQTLADKNAIEETTYRSLFNGITTVRYHAWMDLCDSDLPYHNYVSYIGEEENVQKVYDDIQQEYDVTMPEYLQATEEDMIIIVWLLLAVLLLIMNGVDVIRRKKEVVVRISFGESVAKMIAKSVMVDLLLDGVAYALARIFVFRFMSGEYQWKLAFVIFVVGCVLASCVYFTFAVYDIKKAFSNVNDSKSVLYVMYGLKVAVTFLTVFTLAANLSSLQSDMLVKNEDRILSQYGDDSYFTLRDFSAMGYGLNEVELEQRDAMNEEVWQGIYESYYDKITPVICVSILEGESDYNLVNQYAEGMLQGFQDLLANDATDSDFVVFIPKRLDLDSTKASVEESVEMFVRADQEPFTMEYITYDTRETFAYLSDQAACGIASTVNPVLIYQNQKAVSLDGGALAGYAGNEIMYRLTDANVKEIDQKYELSIHGIENPDQGQIIVNGVDITKKKNKRKYYRDTVGFLFQNFALLEQKTVRENLDMIQKSGRTDISIEMALEKVGLKDSMNTKVYKLSGGEQQRVALARLMIKKCDLILADEPTGSLDEKNSEIVMKILHELNDLGKTVLVVTHSGKIVEEEAFVVRLVPKLLDSIGKFS